MLRPVTKWNSAIADPGVVPEIVRKAFKIAEFEKPGAVHIELSEDLAAADAPENLAPLPRLRVRRPGPDYKAINQAMDLLRAARRPLVIAGNGAIRKLASKHLTRLVTKFNIPVISTFMGKGAVSARLEQSLLTLGLGFKDYVMEAVEAADLILTVGYDIAEYPPENWNPQADKQIVHIDFVPAEVYKNYAPAVEVICDISGALWEMRRRLREKPLTFEDDWYSPIRNRILDDIEGYQLQEGNSLHTPGALNVIRDVLPDDGLVISDVGSHKVWIARNFPTCCANGCIISNGLASMGIAVPGAVAAYLADPTRKIVAATGDGGFLMNSQELETAKRIGAKFTVVIFNDNDYGLISWKQSLSRARSVGTRIGNPDFKSYAESFGIKGYRPRDAAEFRAQLTEAIATDGLSVIEVRVETSVNNELVQKLERYWSRPR
jgi:acetolactate synthase-1/2/3 large subunit